MMDDALLLLKGRRILVVEDEYFIADEARRLLEQCGAEVVGPAPTVRRGMELLEEGGLDAAILDVNIDGEMVFPIADRLDEMGIPFVFATGYESSQLPKKYAGFVLCEKPSELAVIARALFGNTPRAN
ncbi:response regulator [Rhizobium sp. CFBP 8762]|uniref:response regulator n=1 Tax=Rhizobium sp. CFBP 8762 TaxID=2775279 RepID=UPI0017838526|nr:response regulator [Rhizobium sp. CFBP 8762]MBD8554176.1 response regulator [Rhizobium sp. CFBP 8762]